MSIPGRNDPGTGLYASNSLHANRPFDNWLCACFGSRRDQEPLYRGEKKWNLNPLRGLSGHFMIHNDRLHRLKPDDRFEIRVKIVETDTVGRDHQLLEDGYVYNHVANYWYFEP